MQAARWFGVSMVGLLMAMPIAAQERGGQRGAAPAAPPMTLTVSGFSDGGQIPVKFSQAAEGAAPGEGTSPAMTWTNVPAGTQSFVLHMHDLEVARLHAACMAAASGAEDRLYLADSDTAAQAVLDTAPAEDTTATLRDSLTARLDELSGAKKIAQIGAVVGRQFRHDLVRDLCDMPADELTEAVAALVASGLVWQREEQGNNTYTFKHALIQETAYQSLLKRKRQHLHARIAHVLEERFPERVASEPEVIARHYDQAGLAAEASAHYQRTGERATRRAANEEAIGHLRRALALVEMLTASPERDQRELALQMAIGAPLVSARGQSHPETEQTYARARVLISRIGQSPELPRLLAGMAAAYFVRGDLATAAELAHEALAAAERTGEPFDLLSSHYLVGLPLLFQGNFSAALQHFEHSIRLYDPAAHAALGFITVED
jgi:tetratricopeptide (TPR) repeat protein